MKQRKFKWPKFLTIGRTLIILIVLIAGIILLTYFLGGYQEAKAEASLIPFSEDGFVTYAEMIANAEPLVAEYNDEFALDVEEITMDNYLELIPQLKERIKTDNNKKALTSKLQELSANNMPADIYNEFSNVYTIPVVGPDYSDEQLIYNETYQALVDALDENNYITDYPVVRDQMQTVENRKYLVAKLEELRDSIGIGNKYYTTTRSQIQNVKTIDNAALAKELLNSFELLFSNENFAYYFNRRYTSFRLDQIKNGKVENVINSWYSIPQETTDANAKGGKSVIYQQQSPIILKYLNRGGAVKQYTAYEYCINDNIGTETDPEYVDPGFSIKIDEANKSIQVYYNFTSRGITYDYFPQYIYDRQITEYTERSKTYVAELIATMDEYLENNNLTAISEYVNAHAKVSNIINYFTNVKSTVGIEACKLAEEIVKSVSASNYLEIIDEYHNDIEMLHKLACLMIRVEYEADAQIRNEARGYFFNPRESIFLVTAYDKPVEQEATTDDEGNEVNNNYRGISSYESLKTAFRKYLYQIFYTKYQYTDEELSQNQAAFGVQIEKSVASYKVAIEYQLTEGGIKCSIINNSIYESDPRYYPLFQIDILPYFTSVINQVEVDEHKYTTNGYMIIPDGSGAIISLNNGKQEYNQYSKRVYSTDLAYGYKVKQEETNDILLPMFGLTKNRINDINNNRIQNAYQVVVRASTGASQTSITSQVSLFIDSYNRTFMSTTFRESQLVTIGTGYYAKDITKFTTDYVRVDTVIDYYFSSSETKDFNYADVAKFYQDVLLKEGVISKAKADTTDQTVVNAEVLGIYDYTTNFLGIVYDGHDTLTTLDQSIEIMDDLKKWGAEELNLIYRGWRKAGLVNETFDNMSFGNKLGSKKSYKNFVKYIKENSVTLYPVTSFIEINKYKESYGKSRYSTRDVSSEYTVKYPYDLASNVYDKKQNAVYTLSPRFFATFANKLAKNYKKSNPELTGMSFEKLGSAIVGDYKKYHIFYRYNSVAEQLKVFDTLYAQGITDINLNAPYEYAIKYASNVTNLPYESTLYEVFDYSIPLYQLIFSGYVDYSGLAINQYDEQGIMQHLMNIFKTGSNVHFIFSYDSSSELIQTDYNYYYYTEYSKWENEVKTVLSELAKYELHKYVLDYYEQYNGVSNVYVSTYKAKKAALNGTYTADAFKVYLNYSDKEITLPNGTKLSKWNYYVDKEV